MCIRSNKNPGVIVSFICVGYFFSFSRSYRIHRRMYDIYIYFLFFLLYLRYFPNVDSFKSFFPLVFPLLSLKFPILFMRIYKLRLLRKRAIHLTALNSTEFSLYNWGVVVGAGGCECVRVDGCACGWARVKKRHPHPPTPDHRKQEKLYCYNSTLIAHFHFSYDQLHK